MSNEDDFYEWSRRRRLPFGGLPFRGLSRDLNDLMREFDRMFQETFRDLEKEVPRELVRERRLPNGRLEREVGPFVYGYSVTMGPDGKPVIREFGNLRPTERGRLPMLKEGREPLVEVIDEGEAIKVVAEVPGVEKEDIKLDASDTSLSISVDAPRKYSKILELPSPIVPESAKASYKNGILEVTLTKVKPTKPKGRPIKIE